MILLVGFYTYLFIHFLLTICVSSLRFELYEVPKTWQKARDDCIQRSMDLTIFDTQAKMDQIYAKMNRSTSTSYRLDVWIGMSWHQSTNQFHWVNGEPVDSNEIWWKSRETEDAGTCGTCQNCVSVAYEPSASPIFSWRSKTCSDTMGYSCSPYETTTYSPSTYISSAESTTNERTNLPTSMNSYYTSHVSADYELTSEVSTRDQNGQSVTSDYMETSEVPTSSHNVPNISSGYMQTSEVSTNGHNGPSVTSGYMQTFKSSTTGQHGSFNTTTMSGIRAIVFCPFWASSICECTIIQNISVVVNGEDGDYIYRIDRKKTSAYHRKHNSAHDERFSARCIGLTGSAVLIIVVLSFVVLDINRMSNRRQKKN